MADNNNVEKTSPGANSRAVSTSTTATIRGVSYSKGDSFKCAKAAKGNAGSEGNGDTAKQLTEGTTYYFQYKATGDAVTYPYAIATSSSGSVQGWYKEEIFPYATYSITYNANGGSGAPSKQTKTHGTALTLSSTKPTKSSTSATGYKVSFNVNGGSGTVSALTSSKTTTYTFSKWNTKSDGSGTNYSAGGSYTANAAATLYAQYTSSTSNGSITLPAAPTRDGYTFNGWYTAASGGSKAGAAGASYTPTAATTLYAQWTEKPKPTYTITYNSNGTGVSNMPSNQTKTEGVDLTISSTIPTRSGYTFSHWNTASDGSGYAKHPTKTSVTYNGTTKTCNNYIESNSNLTLYAIWEIVDTTVTYTISYNYASGQKGTYAPASGTVGQYVRISNPTRSGYTFAGWSISGMNPSTSKPCYYGNSQTDSSNTKKTSGTTLSGITAQYFKDLRNTSGTVTFTATWEEIPPTTTTYTISYSYDGGQKGTYAPTSGEVGSYVQISNPTKSGYTFKGWNITGMNPNTTYPCYYGTSTTDSANTRMTSGTSLSGITATQFKNLRRTSGTVTFTATWTENPATTYTISYDYDGGVKGTYAPTSAAVGSYVQISNPSKSGGYTFAGWSISGLSVSYTSPAYHGTTQTDSSNTKVTTGTTLSGVKSTYFKNLRSSSGTVTFKATWTSTGGSGGGTTDTTYSISYSLGTGATAGSPAPTSGTKGTYINIGNPTRTNYEFNGWNITGLDSGTHYHGNSKPITGNYGATSATGTSISGVKSTWFSLQATGTVTFTATWTYTGGSGGDTTTSYTIAYEYDGGNKGIYAPTSANVGSYVQISNPTRSNYTFKGWSISGLSVSYISPAYHGTTQTDSSNTKVTSGSTLSGITSTYFKNLRSTSGTVTFTATWEAVQTEDTTYNISYSLGAITGVTAGSPAPTSGTKGTYINIGNPSRTNYTFTGWNITGLDSGTHYHGNSKPMWGDTGATSVTGTSISGVKSTWFKLQATGTVTFTATWESTGGSGGGTTTSYTISYNLAGGQAGASAPTSANVGSYVTISNPSRSGYVFAGWNITGMDSSTHYYSSTYQTDTMATKSTATSLSSIKAIYFKNLRESAGTVTFTATWTTDDPDVTYSISYNLDGGVKGVYAPTTATVDSYVNISNPTKDGYVFAGWNITNMNPTSTKKCYYGRYQYDMSNQSTTNTSLSGIKVTYFKNLRTTAGTVTFTATWTDTDDGESEELSGLILRPVADTALGHTCSSGTAGYNMISEETADDNTTYIAQQVTETTATTVTSTFKLGGTLPSGVFKITGATIKVRGKSDTSGTYSGTYKLSTDSTASNITLNASTYSDTINPDVCSSLIGEIYTSSTFPEISLTISTTGSVTNTGSKTGSQTTPEIRITQAYLQLEYEPILGTAKVYTSNAWHNALPYVFINNAWKMVQAHAQKSSNWKPGQG